MATVFNYAPADATPLALRHTVKLLFGRWEYRTQVTVTFDGRERGTGLLSLALAEAYRVVCSSAEYPTLALRMENGNILESSDEEQQGLAWLDDMLMGYELVASQ